MKNTDIVDTFLNQNNITYEKKYYEEDNYVRYFLNQNFDKGRYYSIIIQDSLTTFEYDSEKYNFVATIIFEEHEIWEQVDKKTMFDLILKHMTTYVESDYEVESNNDTQSDDI